MVTKPPPNLDNSAASRKTQLVFVTGKCKVVGDAVGLSKQSLE